LTERGWGPTFRDTFGSLEVRVDLVAAMSRADAAGSGFGTASVNS
jgi:hypothetical protein